MKPFNHFTLYMILLIGFNHWIFAQTDISGGDVSGEWSISGSPYRIFDSITILNESTLSIEPGVTVEFQGHYGIYVQGRLLAEGTKTDSIIFTVNDTTGLSNPNNTGGGWNGIRLIDTPYENDSTIIEYCIMQYGKSVASSWHDNSGGAICIINYDKVRISHCLLTNNSAGGSEVPGGGAIHMAWSDVKLDHNKFTDNQAVAGGAIHMHESDPIFHNNIMANNVGRDGGGISVWGKSNPTFEGDSILNNMASEFGGGIICRDSSSVTFDHVVFIGNQAPWGGGIGLAGVDATIDSCLVRDNSADNLGGGIAADYSSVSINNCSIRMNTASMSGGIHAWYCTVTITNSEINENTADFGAGLHADFSQLDFLNSAFNENQASYNGGGLHIWDCELLLDRNQFMDNQADVGGAIHINESDPIFKNNAIANNVAREGGGVWFFGKSKPLFEGDSILNNLASQRGGGLMCWDSSVAKLEKVVIMGNQAPWGAGLGLSGIEATINNCMIRNNTAENLGGGISADFCTVTIDNSSITSNSSNMSGGIHSWYTTLDITDSDINKNTADFGGGIHADYSQLNFLNCAFEENQANYNGAGLHIWNSDLVIDQCEFQDNNAVSEGGGIEFNLADTLVFGRRYQIEITQSQFLKNNADYRAGGIIFEQFDSDTSMADILIDQCVFMDNHAERVAGLRISGILEDFLISNSKFNKNTTDLWNGGVSLTNGCTGKVINCEFTDNHATSGNPGASGVSRGSVVHYINCTFANNSASQAGGLSSHRDGKASITNCIFRNNVPVSLYVKGIVENAFSEMYINNCNIQYGLDSIKIDTLAMIHWGEGNMDSVALFSDHENGDYRLLEESPCIDMGTDSIELVGTWLYAPEYDIEGNPRIQLGSASPDIGAYEYQPVTSFEGEVQSKKFHIRTYPNPFNQLIHFELDLKHPTVFTIEIYDLVGSKVYHIFDKKLAPERHQFTWNAIDMNDGIYICRIQVMNEIITKKILLSR